MSSSTQPWMTVLVLLLACADAKPASSKPAPAAGSAKPAASVTASAPAAPELRDAMPLAERLLREASTHPEARSEVERRMQVLREAGVGLTRTRQVLARPLSARYCATALTAAGLGISLCAF